MSVRSGSKNLRGIELVAKEDKTADQNELERGLELVARLLLERWQARHTKEVSDVEEGN